MSIKVHSCKTLPLETLLPNKTGGRMNNEMIFMSNLLQLNPILETLRPQFLSKVL